MSIDLLLLIFCISFALVGLWQGFLHQFISLAGLFVIIFFSFPLAKAMQASGALGLDRPPVLVLWAIACFFIFALTYLTRMALGYWVQWTPLGAMDRWLGLSLGAIKGVVLALVMGMGLQILFEDQRHLSPDLASEIQESRFLVASSDILSIGLFGWSDALAALQEQLNPLRHHQPRLLSPGSPWADEDEPF